MSAKKMLTKEAVRRIQRFMAKHFGKFVEIPKLTETWTTIAEIVIDPTTLGPFHFAIETMEVKVKAATHPETGEPWIILDYSYVHQDGGTNGKRVQLESV